MRFVCGLLILAAGCSNPESTGRLTPTAQNTLTSAELADGWILLFDGETLYGWEAGSQADWKVADGVIAVKEGEKGLLGTTTEWGDYVLKCDFKAPATTNSGPSPNSTIRRCSSVRVGSLLVITPAGISRNIVSHS